ncbi:hypothetical protein DICPUDRAFT_94916 [Dictyostelium purpureum]|uniref:PH domain-containing protein n=1 Tax=Dictyostelium purpureum TaxID=5786 RepID=F0ZQ06_DICPU|nr:uncharacterized protein DICPUDRAFT_94916 [Dictyostelium purpureum]EGC33963.1 hypothetical protein DICPUDRAFT_94916 [Dictyostelium purpureum]|eukprot:XP_003289496.1 hypothetical protein DICPUDRAFT_94916 [Dictyostelium purpureum]
MGFSGENSTSTSGQGSFNNYFVSIPQNQNSINNLNTSNITQFQNQLAQLQQQQQQSTQTTDENPNNQNAAVIFQSMTVSKPDIVHQNNPIYQNFNFGYLGADKILYESILKKQGKTLGLWAKRRFRLTHSSLINYYDETDNKVHRVFHLADISISYRKMATDSDVRICLVINDGTRNHFLYAPIPHQTEAWINALVTQKKIIQQSRSNQILQNITPQYPPFPLSTSPPPNFNSHLYPPTAQVITQPQVVSNTFNFYNYQAPPQYQPPQYNIPIDRSMDGNQLLNFNNGSINLIGSYVEQQQQIQQQLQQQIQQQMQQQIQQQQPPQPVSNDVQWIQHRVVSTDTLAGIAIRYNTTIDVIKRINLIQGNECITHKTLLVPASGVINQNAVPPPPQINTEEERRRKLIQLLAVSENISKEEARSYLVNNDWDFTKAVKNFREDLDWESNHKYN